MVLAVLVAAESVLQVGPLMHLDNTEDSSAFFDRTFAGCEDYGNQDGHAVVLSSLSISSLMLTTLDSVIWTRPRVL